MSTLTAMPYLVMNSTSCLLQDVNKDLGVKDKDSFQGQGLDVQGQGLDIEGQGPRTLVQGPI